MRADARGYSIIVIPGDNIGPESTEAALAVLEAAQKAAGGFKLNLKTCTAGAAHYAEHGTAMTPEAIISRF